MPLTFVCPNCKKPLMAPDGSGGRQVRCPHCQGVATVPLQAVAPAPVPAPVPPPVAPMPAPPPPPPPLPSPEVAEAPFSAAMTGQAPAESPNEWTEPSPEEVDTGALDPRWQKVRQGLDLVRYGTMGMIGTSILQFFLMMMAAFGGNRSRGDMSFGLVEAAGLAAFIVVIVGMFFCISAPPEKGLNTLALAAAICMVTCIASPAGLIVFLIFLRGLGDRFRNVGLKQNAMRYLIAVCALPVGFCLLGGIMAFMLSGSRGNAYAGGTVLGMLPPATMVVMLFLFLGLATAGVRSIDKARLRARMQ